MRKALFVLLLLGLVTPAMGQECRRERTALVLSGGGAKGLAHIGVLAVLDSLAIRPDLIVGTSIGAIVGAMYASGYRAREIDSLARGLSIAAIVRPFRIAAPHPWDGRIPILFMVRGRGGFEFQTGIVDEALPNARLNAAVLRGNLLARGRFDQLPIPFLAVATDLRDRRTVVIGSGDLARAVRASSAIPLVFPPVVVDGAVLVDGGLSANIPIAEARAAGATRVIVSDVSEHLAETLDPESPLALADQLLGFLFQQPAAPLGSGDVFVRPAVQSFRSLDFSPATVAEVLRLGRRAADTTITRARCLPTGPRPNVPAVPRTLAEWTVDGNVSADSVLLARMLGLTPGMSIDPAGLRDRLIGLGSAEAFRGVWLNPTGSADTVAFRIQPVRAPRMVGGLGLAYDHERGGKAWAGLFDRQLLGTTLEASALGSAGRYQQELFATALWHADGGWSRVTSLITLRGRREEVRRFDGSGEELPSIGTSDGRFTAALEGRVGQTWLLRLGGELVTWGGEAVRGVTRPGASLRLLRTASDGIDVQSDVLVTNAFQSAQASARRVFHAGRWTVVPAGRVGLTGGAPLQWTLPLGGLDGFPGLHQGERRGAREIFGSLRLNHGIKGPIDVRVLLAGGRTWTPSTRATDGWLGGGRLTLGADTPIGPMDVGYGVTTTGRGAFYLRLGQWF